MSVGKKWSRRDLLKGLAGVPIIGSVFWAGASSASKSTTYRQKILDTLDIKASLPPASGSMAGDVIRIGIIGFGIRGPQLCEALGFATKSTLKLWEEDAKINPNDRRLQSFLSQESLNVKITAVCDVFTVRAQDAVDSFSTDEHKVKLFRTYQELLASKDVDAVVIATPDHWHAPMAIDALNAGKHVYVEKPMTHNIKETYELREAVEANPNVVFAVGHQHRQTQSFLVAQDIIKKKVLGHVSLIQANTNRNSDNGAWQYDIHKDASLKTIDWDQFLGNAPKTEFNKEHFFRWRKWWAYGSGLSGDLLSHDYDRVNCILKMGIPSAVSASGGIYTHRDGRNVPDVMQVNMEFPEFSSGASQRKGKERGMTLVYSATLGNQYPRRTVLMGHDASMELGNSLSVFADANSSRFGEMIENEQMTPDNPIYQYDPAKGEVDGVTSATSKYFADKGLLWTYRDGKKVNSTHLHMREWLSCIRNGGTPSCDIKAGFEEAISSHMAGLAYKLGRTIQWDKKNDQLVPIDGYDLDEVLLANQERIT